MIQPVVRVVDVYPYRRAEDGTAEFLLCRRASHQTYAGQWRMIGGKIAEDEAAWQTALRELHEETQLAPVRMWTIPSLNMLYQWHRDRVNLIPGFAVEVTGDPVLNHEHDRFAWHPVAQAARCLAWPEQRRLLLLADELLRTGIPPEAEVDAELVTAVMRELELLQAA